MQDPQAHPPTATFVQELVDSLLKNAPTSFKCIFLNCELHLTAGGATVSGDLFAVTKPIFRTPRRDQRTLALEEVRLLDALAPLLTAGTGLDHATLDLVVRSNKSFSAFVTYEPLRRIGGDNDFFKTKHLAYTQVEPWLARVS